MSVLTVEHQGEMSLKTCDKLKNSSVEMNERLARREKVEKKKFLPPNLILNSDQCYGNEAWK